MSNRRISVLEIPVPLVRDYQQINREVRIALDAGHSVIRLTDVGGHRLLAAGLRGPWSALIEICGNAGPELAAGLDAPGLTILCRGSAADGAGRGLKQGRLIILGGAEHAVGIRMEGGSLLVGESSGHRAGLRQQGGTIILLGPTGRLIGDRQAGGVLLTRSVDVNASPRRLDGNGRLGRLHDPSSPDDSAIPDDLLKQCRSLSACDDLLRSLERELVSEDLPKPGIR